MQYYISNPSLCPKELFVPHYNQGKILGSRTSYFSLKISTKLKEKILIKLSIQPIKIFSFFFSLTYSIFHSTDYCWRKMVTSKLLLFADSKMNSNTMVLHLTQVERRFRRINTKLRRLFNLYRLVIKEDNPNEIRSHVMLINEMNNLIQLMIIDTIIHLGLSKKKRQEIALL